MKKKSPLNPRVRNWLESCQELMQCDWHAVWTRQLLCGGGIAAIRQWQIRPQECCGDVALYGGEKTAVTYKYPKRFLRRSVPISVKVNRLVIIWWWKKTAVTYKCQKRFLSRLCTYKSWSESACDHMMVKNRQLPINVKNGFWDGSVPKNVKVKWLVTTNKKNSPLNPRVRNWQESCQELMQCDGCAVWVFLLVAEQGSCCVSNSNSRGLLCV
jgi:hypothetical protein